MDAFFILLSLVVFGRALNSRNDFNIIQIYLRSTERSKHLTNTQMVWLFFLSPPCTVAPPADPSCGRTTYFFLFAPGASSPRPAANIYFPYFGTNPFANAPPLGNPLVRSARPSFLGGAFTNGFTVARYHCSSLFGLMLGLQRIVCVGHRVFFVLGFRTAISGYEHLNKYKLIPFSEYLI